MNCDRYSEWISEAVDGTLDTHKQAELDAHCRACAECREWKDDLLEIRAAAATLDRFTPSPDVWKAIEAKIDQQPRRADFARWRGGWGALAAAAALVMMLGAAAWFGLSTRPSSGTTEPAAELARATSELQLAEQHYLNAIASLEQLTVQKDSLLDPAVAAEIAQSLQSIDRAISDSRAALETDPGSFVAQTSLLEALRMKVALLQETVSLMNARS
jgi:predicted anti-sigma-YlaC factor YlaD